MGKDGVYQIQSRTVKAPEKPLRHFPGIYGNDAGASNLSSGHASQMWPFDSPCFRKHDLNEPQTAPDYEI